MFADLACRKLLRRGHSVTPRDIYRGVTPNRMSALPPKADICSAHVHVR